MITTYLDQLEKLAAELGVDLSEACKAEGIAQTTLWRWRTGAGNPREATAEAVANRIRVIAERQKNISHSNDAEEAAE